MEGGEKEENAETALSTNPQRERERERAVGKSEGGRYREVKRGRKKKEGSHL